MMIFTAQGQRGKEAEGIHFSLPLRTFASSHLCLFAVKNSIIRLTSHKATKEEMSILPLWLCGFVTLW